MTWLENLRSGLLSAFDHDERVHLLGEDVLDPYGGAFKATAGLSTRFPTRVHTTPISEGGIVGVGVGMSLRGLRPIVELMFGDFLTLAVDQLVNSAAKFTMMFGREMSVPIVVRTPVGGGRGYGPTHSQTLEKLVLGQPGIAVVAPSLFHDPAAEIRRAVDDDFPVLFVEHKLLYPSKPLARGDDILNVHSGADDNCLLVRNFDDGGPDATIACYGGTTLMVADVMRRLAPEEIRLEACVPADISSIPEATLSESIERSGHLVVVDEAPAGFGWASQVAASATSAAWGSLKAPVSEVSALPTVIPTARALEDEVLPSRARIERELLACLE